MTGIDIHAHYFPSALVERLEKLGAPKMWPVHPDSLAERVEDLERADIALQVLGLGHNQPDIECPEDALAAAQFANDVYADVVRDQPRLGAFGAVPLPHANLAIAEAERCLDELGFHGIGLGTTSLGRSLDDESYGDLWALLSDRRTVVFVHPVGTPDTWSSGMDHPLVGPTFGGPHEAGLATLHLLRDDIPRRYPGISWVVATMGGTFSLLWRRFEEISESIGVPEALGDVERKIRSIYYDTTLTDDPVVLRSAAEVFGKDRIVFGSDAPRVEAGEAMERIRKAMAPSPEDWNAIRGATAAPLLTNVGFDAVEWRASDSTRTDVPMAIPDLDSSSSHPLIDQQSQGGRE